jgi:hypothetical protein
MARFSVCVLVAIRMFTGKPKRSQQERWNI